MSNLIGINAVCAKLGGVHPATVYRRVSAGSLPQPMKFGPQVTRWREEDIDAAIQRIVEEEAQARSARLAARRRAKVERAKQIEELIYGPVPQPTEQS